MILIDQIQRVFDRSHRSTSHCGRERELRADRGVVLKAVNDNGRALEYASVNTHTIPNKRPFLNVPERLKLFLERLKL